MRYLSLFLAAMFFMSSAAAAVRACAGECAAEPHSVECALAAHGAEPSCAQPQDVARCLSRCIQSYKSGEQGASAYAPAAVAVASGAGQHRIALPVGLGAVVLAETAPIVGPPMLTM